MYLVPVASAMTYVWREGKPRPGIREAAGSRNRTHNSDRKAAARISLTGGQVSAARGTSGEGHCPPCFHLVRKAGDATSEALGRGRRAWKRFFLPAGREHALTGPWKRCPAPSTTRKSAGPQAPPLALNRSGPTSRIQLFLKFPTALRVRPPRAQCYVSVCPPGIKAFHSAPIRTPRRSGMIRPRCLVKWRSLNWTALGRWKET